MDIEISTSDPDAVDPAQVAEVLQRHGNYFVLSVTVNEGERVWNYDPEADLIEVRGCSCGMADYGAPGHDGDPNGPAAHEDDEPGHSEREIRQARGDIGWEGN